MQTSSKATKVLKQIHDGTKLGDLRKIAKSIKKDHHLAMELWATGKFLPRLLSILIMDNKLLSQDSLDKIDREMFNHIYEERIHLMDWLMANQLSKSKKTIGLMNSWKNSSSALQRRAFWYYQGRLRWTGQKPPQNTTELLSEIEAKILNEKPEVQWAMNFVAGWIGVYDKKFRPRCIKLGAKTGLYKDEMVSKGCTPNYLPEFIKIEANKRNL
ncbi:MAG TPA: DNA alkylation repair protein [Flavobacteriaceae bacterium]|nr:DNA alkylation repair protein [Flavobacteriaceae bacterium]